MVCGCINPDPVGMPKTLSCRVRPARFALLFIAITLAFAVQAAPGLAAMLAGKPRTSAHLLRRAAVTRKAHIAAGVPAQGIFDSCDPGAELTTCEQDLQQMHEAGLQVAVVGFQGDSLDAISAYASYAQSIGMSVMWEINDPGFWGGAWMEADAATDWAPFSTACGCTDTNQVLSYMIHWLAALPATYGYYAADDWTLTRDQVDGLRQYVSEISAADPNHMVMVGEAEGQGTTYYATGATIGNEIYPENTTSLMPYDKNLGTWESVQQSITQDQRAAADTGTASAFILQAFTFGDNLDDGEAVGVCTPSMSQAQCASLLQYPSASVQLELRNQVLANAHPKLILWYTFAEATQGNRWAGLSSVVSAPFPASATVARAEQSHRVARTRAAHHRRLARERAARRRRLAREHMARRHAGGRTLQV